MTKWEEFGMESKVLEILEDVANAAEPHHLGRPFLTAYQIAIELFHRFPDEMNRLGLPVGGKGTGQHSSLPQYVARQLSRRIGAGRLPSVEGGFLSNQPRIAFRYKETCVEASPRTVSMFRLRPR